MNIPSLLTLQWFLYVKIHKVGNDSADMTTLSDSVTSMVRTSSLISDLKKWHLDGRLCNLQNLRNAIRTIGEHSISCGAIVELIDEVQQSRLASRILACCSKCNEEYLFSSCNKVILEWERKVYLGLRYSSNDEADSYRWSRWRS